MYFVFTRLFQATIVMLVVALAGFLVFQFIGDPVLALVGQETSVADREALREGLEILAHDHGVAELRGEQRLER